MSDAELNKAALLIAKLLIRTREGKIHWEHDSRSELIHTLANPQADSQCFRAPLESELIAVVGRDKEQLRFELIGPAPDGQDRSVLSVFLPHTYGQGEQLNPESVVYKDITDLYCLAENPKSVSDDVQYKQAMSFLDKLTA